MSRIVFLLEEYSMKVLLGGMLPRLAPGLEFLCVPHEGKQDLERSIPRKLRAWREPGVQFVVLMDNDGSDCERLKARLVARCREGRRPQTLVRIACQELEAWYLGEPETLAAAYGKPALAELGRQARFRDPDSVSRPSDSIAGLVPEFQKVSGARLMGSYLTLEGNRSASFKVFVQGVLRLRAQS